MICPNKACQHNNGIYSEHETFTAGGDPEWSYSYSWTCSNCGEYVSSYDENFRYDGDD